MAAKSIASRLGRRAPHRSAPAARHLAPGRAGSPRVHRRAARDAGARGPRVADVPPRRDLDPPPRQEDARCALRAWRVRGDGDELGAHDRGDGRVPHGPSGRLGWRHHRSCDRARGVRRRGGRPARAPPVARLAAVGVERRRRRAGGRDRGRGGGASLAAAAPRGGGGACVLLCDAQHRPLRARRELRRVPHPGLRGLEAVDPRPHARAAQRARVPGALARAPRREPGPPRRDRQRPRAPVVSGAGVRRLWLLPRAHGLLRRREAVAAAPDRGGGRGHGLLVLPHAARGPREPRRAAARARSAGALPRRHRRADGADAVLRLRAGDRAPLPVPGQQERARQARRQLAHPLAARGALARLPLAGPRRLAGVPPLPLAGHRLPRRASHDLLRLGAQPVRHRRPEDHRRMPGLPHGPAHDRPAGERERAHASRGARSGRARARTCSSAATSARRTTSTTRTWRGDSTSSTCRRPPSPCRASSGRPTCST